jgi:ornithine cyclodeaminase/alanine dehydrogenase
MVKPGTVVFPMGSYKEVEDDLLLAADTILVDHIGQALHRGGLKTLADEGKITADNITTTIGEMVAGKYELGDVSNRRMVCALIGTGAMDIGCAEMIYRRAMAKGIGSEFDFSGETLSTHMPERILDPNSCR